MFDPTTIEYDGWMGSLQTINNLPAYDGSVGVDEMLDLVREIQQSGNYYWVGVVFPGSNDILASGGVTLSGTIPLPSGTYVTSIQFYNDYVTNPKGFILKLYDKGTKASIFYGDYALAGTVASNMQEQVGVSNSNPPTDGGSNLDNPFGPNYLMSPFIITPPGILGWELTSKGDVETQANMQVMLACAVPITAASINAKIVSKVA